MLKHQSAPHWRYFGSMSEWYPNLYIRLLPSFYFILALLFDWVPVSVVNFHVRWVLDRISILTNCFRRHMVGKCPHCKVWDQGAPSWRFSVPQYRTLLMRVCLGLLSYQKTVSRNYVGDFISEDFQSLSFKNRMQLDMCNQRQSETEGNQLGHD